MRLGLITTGQGPRPDLLDYHRSQFERCGAPIEIAARDLFDDLPLEEARKLVAVDDRHSIVAPFRNPLAKGHRLGDGWEGLAIGVEHYRTRLAKAVADMESEGCGPILFACAAEFPGAAIPSNRFLVQPRPLLVDAVRSIARMTSRSLRLGVVVMAAHAATDEKDWLQSTADTGIENTFLLTGGSMKDLERLPEHHFDIICMLGYGFGCAPGDDVVIREIEDRFEAPVLLPSTVAARFVTHLVLRNG